MKHSHSFKDDKQRVSVLHRLKDAFMMPFVRLSVLVAAPVHDMIARFEWFTKKH
jgi:hypothetical protein